MSQVSKTLKPLHLPKSILSKLDQDCLSLWVSSPFEKRLLLTMFAAISIN